MRAPRRSPTNAWPHARTAAPPRTALATVAATALALLLGAPPAEAQNRARAGSDKQAPVYRWVDEHGVVHYGDAVPPQYSEQDKTVLNAQGVPVRTIEGRRTPEQIEAAARTRAAEERARQQAVLDRQRDQNLLATYLTVEEIESLRDRRVEILDAQARVTNQYVEQLRARQKSLEQQAQRFRPYNGADNAPPLPDALAEDLVRTANDIRAQERSLDVKRQETEKLKAQFASDIARFRELKRIESEYARTAQPRP